MVQFADNGVWRDLVTGVDPFWADPDEMMNDRGIVDEPIETRVEGPYGLPWYEGLEDPSSPTGLRGQSPEPTYPDESVGARMGPGAYEGAYRTHGTVRAWGHEPSGGVWGDQAIGRIMRFPANIPERWDPNGVQNIDYRDALAAAIAANNAPVLTDAGVVSELVYLPGAY